jgi:PAS domain-containing protein
MNPSPSNNEAKIGQLETQIRHLQNELVLTQTEYQNLINNYFDIFSNMEKMVEERTRELNQVQSQLEIKTRELQIMLDASPTLIFYKDTQGRYIRANRRFSDFLNIPITTSSVKPIANSFPTVTIRCFSMTRRSFAPANLFSENTDTSIHRMGANPC